MGLLIFSRWKDNGVCCIIYSKTLSELKNSNDIREEDVFESIILRGNNLEPMYFIQTNKSVSKQTFTSKKQFL